MRARLPEGAGAALARKANRGSAATTLARADGVDSFVVAFLPGDDVWGKNGLDSGREELTPVKSEGLRTLSFYRNLRSGLDHDKAVEVTEKDPATHMF